MATHDKPPAFTKPPYYASVSRCEGVYGGEEHWAVFADGCRGAVADIEGGLTPEAQAKAEFIVRACNSHDELLDAARGLYDLVTELREDGCDLFDDHAPLLGHCYAVLQKHENAA